MLFPTLLLALQCVIPSGIHIQAPDPCFVERRIEREWPELEARVKFVRETLELPYQPMPLAAAAFDVVEHGDIFKTTEGDDVLGVYSPAGGPNAIDGQVATRPRIDYARRDEQDYRVILHEMGHYRYDVEETRWGEEGQGGYFMHGVSADAVVEALNHLLTYLFPMPHNHPYWPGYLGQKGRLHTNGFWCEMEKAGAS